MADIKALASTVVRFPTVQELKKLPILYVLERSGVAAFEENGGVYTCLSPFRKDRTPSFDIFGPDLDRWGDFAEGTTGDVLDLLQRFVPSLPFVGVKDWAARLLQESEGWQGPRVGGVRKAFDLEAARRYVNNVLACSSSEAVTVLQAWQSRRKGQSSIIPATWLRNTFQIGFDGRNLTIPYFDRSGVVMAFKTRNLEGGPPVAVAGSDGPWPSLLYGMQLDGGHRAVVLCEGESDVWSGTYAAGQEYTFLGLPTGAGSQPKQAPLLAGRRVILAFDGDPAGRAATRTWIQALEAVGAEVLDARVPWERDLDSLSPAWLRQILSTARRWPEYQKVLISGDV